MLYLTIYLRPGHAAACFERNQLMPSSINLSLLYAGHMNDLHIKTTCGPPRNFRHASTCPRIDHSASGLILLTPRTFNTPSHAHATDLLVSLRLPSTVNLRQQNKLSGPFFKTYVTTLADHTRTTASRRVPSCGRSFRAVTHHHLSISGAFQHLSRVTFQLSLTLLFRYRFRVVFSFGG